MVQPRHGVARCMDVADGVTGHFAQYFVGLEVEHPDRAARHPQGAFFRDNVVLKGNGVAGWGFTGAGGFVEVEPEVALQIGLVRLPRFVVMSAIPIALAVLRVCDFDPAVAGEVDSVSGNVAEIRRV